MHFRPRPPKFFYSVGSNAGANAAQSKPASNEPFALFSMIVRVRAHVRVHVFCSFLGAMEDKFVIRKARSGLVSTMYHDE